LKSKEKLQNLEKKRLGLNIQEVDEKAEKRKSGKVMGLVEGLRRVLVSLGFNSLMKILLTPLQVLYSSTRTCY
jgi:hypothetical protein